MHFVSYCSDTVVEEDDLSDLMLHFVRLGVQDRRAVCEPEAVKPVIGFFF